MRKTRFLSVLSAVVFTLSGCNSPQPEPQPVAEPQVDAKALEMRMAAMAARMDTLVTRLELLQTQNDSLRRTTNRMESDLRDREEQIKAIRLELQRLKEIDLRTKRP
jgi:septal ring factor EnvC (AmiA/AmiB activator)